MYEISIESHFSAAHHLNNYCGSCENLHGHNWLVRVTVACETLDAAGLGIDFRVLKAATKEIVEELDHRDLNTVFDPLKLNPSSENIAKWIYDSLKKRLPGPDVRVSSVTVWESDSASATYYED